MGKNAALSWPDSNGMRTSIVRLVLFLNVILPIVLKLGSEVVSLQSEFRGFYRAHNLRGVQLLQGLVLMLNKDSTLGQNTCVNVIEQLERM